MKNDTCPETLTHGNIWLSLKVGGGLGDLDVGRGTWDVELGDVGTWLQGDAGMRGCRDSGTCGDSRTWDVGTGGHD